MLAQSLRDGTDLDLKVHHGESGMVIARTAAAEETLASLLADAIPAAQHHAKSMPNSLNGMVFSLKEIRENLWMHYGVDSANQM